MRHFTRILPAVLIVPLVLALVGPAATSDRWCVVSGELVEIKAELFYSGAWQDITDYVYTRDPINISRGVPNWASRSDPGSMRLTLDNRDGRFSPRNPRSPLYGLIGRNTPIRISAGIGAATKTVRFVGEVISWPARWDVSEQDRYVPIEAAGLLRRLGVPGAPLKSALRRVATKSAEAAAVTVHGVWSFEGVTKRHRSVPADVGPSLTVYEPFRTAFPANIRPELDDTLPGSNPLPLLANGALAGRVSVDVPGGSGNAWGFGMWTRVRDPGGDNRISGQTRIEVFTGGAGNIASWAMRTEIAPPASSVFPSATEGAWSVNVNALDEGGSTVGINVSDNENDVWYDQWRHVWLTIDQIGGNLTARLWTNGVFVDTATAAGTQGQIKSIDVRAARIIDDFTTDPTPDINMSWGHAVLASGARTDLDSLGTAIYEAGFGHTGETATDRAQRLCAEEGVTLTVVGSEAGSTPMGPQRSRRFLELLDEAATAEAMGASLPILTETRSSLDLTWKPRRTFYRTS